MTPKQLPPHLSGIIAPALVGNIGLTYLIFVFFLHKQNLLENKIYTEKTRKLRQNTQKIANFLHDYGKIHSKLPIFRVQFVKVYRFNAKNWQVTVYFAVIT